MILGILLGESYSGIRALIDLSVCVKIYQHPLHEENNFWKDERDFKKDHDNI